MRIVRARHDYTPLNNPEEIGREDLEAFVKDGVEPFNSLILQTKESIEKDYKRCSSNPKTCPSWGQWPVYSDSLQLEMPPPSFASSGGSTGMVPKPWLCK